MLALLACALATPDFATLAEDAWRLGQVDRAEVSLDARVDVIEWPAGARVRVTPVLGGRIVDRASSVVALDSQGGLRRITGPAVRLREVTPGPLDANAAVDRTAVLRGGLGVGELWPPRAEERLLPVGGELRHTWRIEFSTALPPATWTTWVDSTSGEVLLTDKSSFAADGRVFPVSPFHGPPETVPLEYLTSDSELRGLYADAYSCVEWTISDVLYATNTCDAVTRYAWSLDGDFMARPHPGRNQDPFAEVNLYHHVSVVAAYFDQRYGLRTPAPIRTIANFPMANAFYGDFDGDGVGDLSFGFTEEVQFAYDADVVYHEFGHWVVGRIADIPSLGADELGLDWAGGSLNEGAADVFSMLLTLDPDVGEYAGRGFGDEPIRALADDRTCPRGLAGEVHRDGEMLGSLGWNLIEEVGWEVTSDLMFGAVSTWGPDVSWRIAGQSLLDSADDLEAASVIDATVAGRIRDLVEASGMPECSRIIPLDRREPIDAYVLSAGLEGDAYRLVGGAQMEVEVPLGTDRLTVDVTEFVGDEGLAWSVYLRKDEPVKMKPTVLAFLGLGFAVAEEWDWLADGEGEAHLVFDGTSDPPLEPGATYYLAVAGRDAGPIDPFEVTLGRMTLQVDPFIFPEPAKTCGSGGAAGVLFWPLAWLVTRRRTAGCGNG